MYSDEILKAKEQLESTHKYGAITPELNEFSYIESIENGQYTRHLFYQGLLRGIVFVALSPEDQEEIEKIFYNKLNDDYEYFDSILLGEDDPIVHHRFFKKGTYPNNFIFLNDDRTITIPSDGDDDVYDYE